MTPTLSGLWTRESPGYPPHPDYMWVDPERGRIVSFVAYAKTKLVHLQIRNWFAETPAGRARVSLKPDQDWTEHGFRFEGNRLIWTVLDKEQPWIHLPRDQGSRMVGGANRSRRFAHGRPGEKSDVMTFQKDVC